MTRMISHSDRAAVPFRTASRTRRGARARGQLALGSVFVMSQIEVRIASRVSSRVARAPKTSQSSRAMTQIGAILHTRPRDCRHSGAFLARNGALPQYGAWCDACLRWVTKELAWYPGLWLPASHEKLAGIDCASLPVRPHAWFRYCERCQKWASCEVHHIAPRAFFGQDCEAWPTIYLCRPCHDEWHATLTPGLCTTYDAEAHARQLFDYLGLDRIRTLYSAIKAEAERRKAAA